MAVYSFWACALSRIGLAIVVVIYTATGLGINLGFVAASTGVIVLLILFVIARPFRLRLQPKANICVTTRTNIRQIVGGATEQTIIARVGEGIVSAIGSSQTYKAVVESARHGVSGRGFWRIAGRSIPRRRPRFVPHRSAA